MNRWIRRSLWATTTVLALGSSAIIAGTQPAEPDVTAVKVMPFEVPSPSSRGDARVLPPNGQRQPLRLAHAMPGSTGPARKMDAWQASGSKLHLNRSFDLA